MSELKEKIKQLQEMIDESHKIVFFGGAGVSTESGIPDFRSKDGLYNQNDVQFEKYAPEYLLSKDCLYKNPKVFYEFYKQKLDCRKIEPNIIHYKLAELEKANKLLSVVTQNIDGLHQKAGSNNVYEVHGTTQKAYCTKCGKKHDANILFDTHKKIPKCECGGILRPDVTLYGELLPNDAWANAVNDLQKADMLIIGGTSLTVYPANTLTQYFYGEKLVIINMDQTDYDNLADLVINAKLGDVLKQININ